MELLVKQKNAIKSAGCSPSVFTPSCINPGFLLCFRCPLYLQSLSSLAFTLHWGYGAPRYKGITPINDRKKHGYLQIFHPTYYGSCNSSYTDRGAHLVQKFHSRYYGKRRETEDVQSFHLGKSMKQYGRSHRT